MQSLRQSRLIPLHMRLLQALVGLRIPNTGQWHLPRVFHSSVSTFPIMVPVTTLMGTSSGIYLSRLYRLSQLPDLIDPTAPNKAVSIEPATANCDPPAHPEVFASLQPLPPFMHLEPLINVHKQRQIAAVIKSLVSGQHLAFDQHIELHDKKLFQKCLRLRGLDTPTLQRALSLYND